MLSGALGAEVSGINLKDSSFENWNKINNLLLEHKALFFRDQNITSESITVSPTESGNGWVDLAWTYESEDGTIETLCRYFYTITVINLDMPDTDWPDNTVVFCDQENLTISKQTVGEIPLIQLLPS